MKIRIESIKALIRQGKTYEEIGNVYGVSRQRIEQLIRKSEPTQKIFAFRRNPLKIKAQYTQEGGFLEKDKSYSFTLSEEIRPNNKNKLIYYLEILDKYKETKITYLSLEALLKDWNNLQLL